MRSTISKLDLVHRSICVAFDILILTFLLSLSYLIICNFLSISLSCSIHSWQERWWRCFKIILSQVVYTPAQTVQTVSPLCARLLQDITAGQLGVPAPCRILLQVSGHQAPPPPGAGTEGVHGLQLLKCPAREKYPGQGSESNTFTILT